MPQRRLAVLKMLGNKRREREFWSVNSHISHHQKPNQYQEFEGIIVRRFKKEKKMSYHLMCLNFFIHTT